MSKNSLPMSKKCGVVVYGYCYVNGEKGLYIKHEKTLESYEYMMEEYRKSLCEKHKAKDVFFTFKIV